MSKQILIELVGENETGYCYADLYLPASAEEIAEAKERANWNSDSNGIRDISIEHCSTLPKLASFRLDSPTLDELNFLAQRLDAMDGGERTKAASFLSSIKTQTYDKKEREMIITYQQKRVFHLSLSSSSIL